MRTNRSELITRASRKVSRVVSSEARPKIDPEELHCERKVLAPAQGLHIHNAPDYSQRRSLARPPTFLKVDDRFVSRVGCTPLSGGAVVFQAFMTRHLSLIDPD